jgi:hypothetical protein
MEEFLEAVLPVRSTPKPYDEDISRVEEVFLRDKPILSSETMLHKDYDHKGSVWKKNLWWWTSRGFGAKTK